MRRLALAILPFLILSCDNTSFTISGEAPEGATSVVLSKLVGKNPVPIDTIEVDDNGRFCFTGNVERPFVAYLGDESGDIFTDLCVSATDIYVHAAEFGYEVAGGKENEKFNSIRKELNGQPLTADQKYSVMEKSITEDPSCTAYSYVLFRLLYNDLPIEMTEKLEQRFTDEVRGNCYLTILRELIAQTRKSAEGNPMLDFVSKTPAGDTLSISSLADKGTWLLVDFWASWCPYCRKENPLIVELYNRFHQEGLEILSVSLDSDYDEWVKAIEEDNLAWHHVSDLDKWECKAARMYGISAIPGNVLISPDGIIAKRQLHDDDLIQYLENIFQK